MEVSGTLVYIFDVYNLCMHTYIHVLYVHVFMHVYVCVFLHIRVCACVCAREFMNKGFRISIIYCST